MNSLVDICTLSLKPSSELPSGLLQPLPSGDIAVLSTELSIWTRRKTHQEPRPVQFASGWCHSSSSASHYISLLTVASFQMEVAGVVWLGLLGITTWSQRGFTLASWLCSRILCLCVIAFAYIFISRALNRTSTFIETINREPNRNKPNMIACQSTFKSALLVENKRTQRVLTPLILVFAFRMLPLNVFRLLFVVWPAITEGKYSVRNFGFRNPELVSKSYNLCFNKQELSQRYA